MGYSSVSGGNVPVITLTEYARLRGWHHSTVQGKIKDGTISPKSIKRKGKNVFIDSERADLDLEFSGLDAHTKKEHESPAEPVDEVKADTQEKVGRYRDAKISHEELKARKLELEVAEREGRLLDAEEVRQRIVKLVSESREALLNIPAKLAPVLVSITDVMEMENKLIEEINQALTSLSRLTR